jgi:type IV secretory pathway ATPase VirB11/archaellum biosynthesis ATPase
LRALVAAPLLLLAAPVPAQVPFNPAAPENRQVLPAFTYETIEPVLRQINARFERRGTAERPALQVTFPNGRRAAIVLGSCERQGGACRALSIQALWPRPATLPADRLATNIQRFNQRFAYSSAYVTLEGGAALRRYLTADYGFLRGDLAVNLLVFAQMAARFQTEVLR